jgi:putative membrane protein
MQPSMADHHRIAEAVALAERGTSGEIRCVVADQRDLMQLAFIAAVLALALPGLALALGLRPDVLFTLSGGWAVIDPAPADYMQQYVTLQAVLFGAILGIGLSPLPRWLLPAKTQAAMVHRAALAQFVALGLTQTRDRTGVLLYVSLPLRRAEVLADAGIWEAAPHESWDDVVALLVDGLKRGSAADGFVAAVGRTGEILSAHLPPRSDDRNELPDHLTETR